MFFKGRAEIAELPEAGLVRNMLQGKISFIYQQAGILQLVLQLVCVQACACLLFESDLELAGAHTHFCGKLPCRVMPAGMLRY